MKYHGGPKDGRDVEDTHAGASAVKMQLTYYTEQHTPIGVEEHLYVVDSFGNMAWQGIVSQTDLRKP